MNFRGKAHLIGTFPISVEHYSCKRDLSTPADIPVLTKSVSRYSAPRHPPAEAR